MSYKLTIKVTKEIFEASKMCGTGAAKNYPTNCAVAHAVRDIFPDAVVGYNNIYPFGYEGQEPGWIPDTAPRIEHHVEMEIAAFDACLLMNRSDLKPFEFTVEVPDEVIERINIEAIKQVLVPTHPTLILKEQEVQV